MDNIKESPAENNCNVDTLTGAFASLLPSESQKTTGVKSDKIVNTIESKVVFVGPLGTNAERMKEIGGKFGGATRCRLLSVGKYGQIQLFFLNFLDSESAETAANLLESRREELLSAEVFLSNTEIEFKADPLMKIDDSPTRYGPCVFVSGIQPHVTLTQLNELHVEKCENVRLHDGKLAENFYVPLNYAHFHFNTVSEAIEGKKILMQIYNEDIVLAKPRLFTTCTQIY